MTFRTRKRSPKTTSKTTTGKTGDGLAEKMQMKYAVKDGGHFDPPAFISEVFRIGREGGFKYMINLLPEPKRLVEKGGFTGVFREIFLEFEKGEEELLELAHLRFWNYPELALIQEEKEQAFLLCARRSLEGIETEKPKLFREQGYDCLLYTSPSPRDM